MSAKRQGSSHWERLEARIAPEQKELIQRAADFEGRSLTDFVVGSAVAAARQTTREHEILRLTARGTAAFLAAIENPPAPNERLRAAAQQYREFVGH